MELLIDMFSGLDDLENKTIRAVGDPTERFFEDAFTHDSDSALC